MVHWGHPIMLQPGDQMGQLSTKTEGGGKTTKRCVDYQSDNFASWGGGDSSYHKEDLTQLIKAVDFPSVTPTLFMIRTTILTFG